MLQLPHGPDDDPARQQKFEAIVRAMPGFGGKSIEIRFGTATGTWPGGSPRANNDSTSHGLGRAPVVVLVTVTSSPSASWFPVVATFAYTSTGFSFSAVTSDGSSPAATTAYAVAWIAIG